MPKPLNKQSRQMIASLLKYFTKERDHGGPFMSLNDVQERVAEALKVSLRTVNTINRMVETKGSPKSPKRIPLRKRPVTDISESEKCDIRDCIYDMVENSTHCFTYLFA
nr:PREDICTED: uncharacterized protein LOC107397864 [Tribolium castaneum]|eukprot:XP_015835126.1 PREDICTED: uncharacterized protein LOC107397864 [Tribolium castaneum]